MKHKGEEKEGATEKIFKECLRTSQFSKRHKDSSGMKNSANSKEFHTKKHHRWSSKKLKIKILESSKKKKFPLEKKKCEWQDISY